MRPLCDVVLQLLILFGKERERENINTRERVRMQKFRIRQKRVQKFTILRRRRRKKPANKPLEKEDENLWVQYDMFRTLAFLFAERVCLVF